VQATNPTQASSPRLYRRTLAVRLVCL